MLRSKGGGGAELQGVPLQCLPGGCITSGHGKASLPMARVDFESGLDL